MLAAALTQAPHATLYNGGESAIARQLWGTRTQRQAPHGPRIDAAIAGMQPGESRLVFNEYREGLLAVRRPDYRGGYSIIDWTPHDVWHAGTQQIIRGGKRIRNKVEVYSDLTGEHSERAMPAAMGRATGTGHWYGMTCADGDGEHVYLGNWRLHVASWTWTELPPHILTNGGSGSMYAWMDDLFDGRGGLVKYGGNNRRFLAYDPQRNVWAFHVDGLPGTQHALVCYHAAHQRLLMIGGSYTPNTTALVDRLGDAVVVEPIPALAKMSSGGWVVPHPAGCWLVNTTDPARLYAYWPDGRGWVDVGPSPSIANSGGPNAAYDAARGIVLLTGTKGLHAYKLPTL